MIVLAWLIAVLDPPGDRLGDGRHHYRVVTDPRLGRGAAHGSGVAGGAGGRRGSLFFSHVNDAGFWLVNQYFRLSVGQTIKTWSIMETVLSVSGLVVVLLLDLVI